MNGELVVAQLFRLDRALALTRRRAPSGHRPAAGNRAAAVLVIPRGGRLREPRLMLLGERPVRAAARPGALDFADVHAVDRHGDPAGREVADVLFDGPFFTPRRLVELLERYPGCGAAAGTGPRGHLAALRTGSGGVQLVEAFVAPETSSGTAAAAWPAIGGSFLHCWSLSGLGLGELHHSVLITGELAVPRGGPAGCLAVTGRVRVRVDGVGDAERRAS
ncbi:hypothetical protein [Actinomadura rugatobispora]|uniref:Uncharacterized protein n=1 Tax=Actinomadura rugatobispora TaxID=1994 RepID=A0ABW1AIP3_9ACTN|nr:hypothetical protein GCM10010200_030180 [Actinomadura rugatobispora]